MSRTKMDRRPGPVSVAVSAASRRDHQLIARAARRTDLAGTALKSAAGDLDEAHGDDGNTLTGLAEVVLEEATRVSHLAEDIESRRPAAEDGESGDEAREERSTSWRRSS